VTRVEKFEGREKESIVQANRSNRIPRFRLAALANDGVVLDVRQRELKPGASPRIGPPLMDDDLINTQSLLFLVHPAGRLMCSWRLLKRAELASWIKESIMRFHSCRSGGLWKWEMTF